MSDRASSATETRGTFTKAGVRDAPVEGRTVLCRADLNVPLDGGEVADDTRIRASLPTLHLLRERSASVVLVSHLGRPEDREPGLSMAPVATRLGELTGGDVALADAVVGDSVRASANALQAGDVLLLENSRYEPGETKNDSELADQLAELAEIYVNDAFGAAHRAHATTEGVAHRLPGYAGLLLEREVRELTAVRDNPEPPLVVVLGGAKVSDKIGVIERFLEVADKILIGGAMCFSFFRAMEHSTGNSLVDEEGVGLARRVLVLAHESRCELELPADLVIADEFSDRAASRVIESQEVPEGQMGLDIGPLTAAAYAEEIEHAGTVLWNGPMGAFELEPFEAGTRKVAEAVARTQGRTVVGGGDSVAALVKFGLADKVDWLSTGGGASLELLEGKTLPGVETLLDAEEAGSV